ncbi:MAG: chorismate mutase [Clostridia bacterium]|nr:chorismate mutase [Clostridia bacterium]
MRELTEIRMDLDQVDREIVALFEKRMGLAAQVAEYKIAKGMPVLDRSREDMVLQSRMSMLEDGRFAPGVRELFECLMALSRREQERLVKEAEQC